MLNKNYNYGFTQILIKYILTIPQLLSIIPIFISLVQYLLNFVSNLKQNILLPKSLVSKPRLYRGSYIYIKSLLTII